MYNIYHRTKTGDRMLIAEMEDSHLLNTIKYFCKHIQTAKQALTNEVKANKFDKALFGAHIEMDDDDLETVISEMTKHIQPYLGEAMLRGLDASEVLQETFGRSGKISFQEQKNLKFLVDNNNQYDYDDTEEVF